MLIGQVRGYDGQVIVFGRADHVDRAAFRSESKHKTAWTPDVLGIILDHLVLIYDVPHFCSGNHSVGTEHLMYRMREKENLTHRRASNSTQDVRLADHQDTLTLAVRRFNPSLGLDYAALGIVMSIPNSPPRVECAVTAPPSRQTILLTSERPRPQ